jgi:predicted membrane-bound mannosyltransferase
MAIAMVAVIGGSLVFAAAMIGFLWWTETQPPHRRRIIRRVTLWALVALVITSAVMRHDNIWILVTAVVFGVLAVAGEWRRSRRRV